MKYHIRFYIALVFFSLLFLFYPGNSYPLNIFAFNRNLFAETSKENLLNKTIVVPYHVYAAEPFITARGAYVVHMQSFTPIFERRAQDRFLPASTAKILTALVAYDIYKPDEVIEVKQVVEEGQVMGLVSGERITVENLLYGILIHSGNDAAYALADHIGRERFMELVAQKAQELSMTNTDIKNPAGLDAPGQHTSAFDLALAGRELLGNPYLRKIVGIKEIIISDEDFTHFHTLTNVNRLLGELSGVGGLKTGYTEDAGENLVTFYRKGGHEFLIVLLKSEDRFEDTTNVVNWIDATIGFKTIEL